jgi:ABC-type sugar transport system permease subunit
MARRFFIPIISLFTAAIIGYALQVHQPSRKDFIAWTAFAALVIGALNLIAGILVSLTSNKKLAKDFFRTALLLLSLGGGVVAYIYFKGDFDKWNI